MDSVFSLKILILVDHSVNAWLPLWLSTSCGHSQSTLAKHTVDIQHLYNVWLQVSSCSFERRLCDGLWTAGRLYPTTSSETLIWRPESFIDQTRGQLIVCISNIRAPGDYWRVSEKELSNIQHVLCLSMKMEHCSSMQIVRLGTSCPNVIDAAQENVPAIQIGLAKWEYPWFLSKSCSW